MMSAIRRKPALLRRLQRIDVMGLTIHYRLTLRGRTSFDEVRARLTALKDFASTVGFDAVLGPHEYTLDQLHQEGGHRDIVPILVSSMAGDDPDFYGVPQGHPCVVTFGIAVGRHSEPAIFGFIAPGSRARYEGSTNDGCPGDWYWSSWCKTQYASLVSRDHLIRCHTGLVRVLDHAMSIGIDVAVHDETGYWEHRSTEKLVAAVEDMNRIIARFAGALSDRLGGGHSVQAPIFEHAEFEHLEMELPGRRDQADGSNH